MVSRLLVRVAFGLAIRARSLAWLLLTASSALLTVPAHAQAASDTPNQALVLRGDALYQVGHAAADAEVRIAADASQPLSFTLCDVDRDGDQDLLVGTVSKLLLYRTDATGWPARGHVWSAAYIYARKLRCADVDGDGWNDVLVASANDRWWLFGNDGAGRLSARRREFVGDADTLQPAVQTQTAPGAQPEMLLDQPPPLPFVTQSEVLYRGLDLFDLAVADLDGDGAIDLLLAQVRADRVQIVVLRNAGAGQFQVLPAQVLPNGTLQALLLHDMDGDQRPDLLTVYKDRLPRLQLGQGDGSFAQQALELGAQIDDSYSLAAGDLDGDGRPDLVVGNHLRSKRYLQQAVVGRSAKGGSVSFAAGRTINRQFRTSERVALADLDSDGRLDVLLCQRGDGPRLHRNLGKGSFAADGSRLLRGSSSGCFSMAAADFNGDGHLDVLHSGGAFVNWLPGKPDGSFDEEESLALRGHVDIADVNLDGHLDVVSTLGIALGDGQGGFIPTPVLRLPDYGQVRLADINGDAAPDLLVLDRSYEGRLLLYRNAARTARVR